MAKKKTPVPKKPIPAPPPRDFAAVMDEITELIKKVASGKGMTHAVLTTQEEATGYDPAENVDYMPTYEEALEAALSELNTFYEDAVEELDEQKGIVKELEEAKEEIESKLGEVGKLPKLFTLAECRLQDVSMDTGYGYVGVYADNLADHMKLADVLRNVYQKHKTIR